jgi:hypothetical protein
MLGRCDRINRCLARENADLRVIGFYRHTGNLVLKTTRLQLTQAAQILSEADGGTWMPVSEAAMRKKVREVRKLQAPRPSEAYGGRPVLHLRSRNLGAAISLHRQKCVFIRSICAPLQCGSAIESQNADDSIAKCGRVGWCAVSGSGCRPDQFPMHSAEPRDPRRRSSPESVHIILGFAFTMSIAM